MFEKLTTGIKKVGQKMFDLLMTYLIACGIGANVFIIIYLINEFI